MALYLLLNAMISVLSKAMMEKVPSLIDQSYVDDMTLLANSQDDLKAAFTVMVPHLEGTMQELNIGKTYVFGINRDVPVININGSRLPSKERNKIFGVIFVFRDGRVWLRYEDADLQWIEGVASRIRSSSLPWWHRTLVTGSLIVGKANFGGEFRMLTAAQERSIRAQLLQSFGRTQVSTFPQLLYTRSCRRGMSLTLRRPF